MSFLLLSILILPSTVFCQVNFVDEAANVGIDYRGKSFGSSWGKINDDSFPDLFTSCHFNTNDLYQEDDFPRYFINNVESFDETILNAQDLVVNDWHGGAFFDLENDGDQDLVLTAGGSSRNLVLINDNGLVLQNEVEFYNLGIDEDASGRTTGIVDVNNDGYIDVILNNVARSAESVPPILMINQNGNSFVDQSELYDFSALSSLFSIPADFMDDGNMSLLIRELNTLLYSFEDGSFSLEEELEYTRVYDANIADFNGDLLPDVFLGLADKGNNLEQTNDSTLRVKIDLGQNQNLGLFETTSESNEYSIEILPSGQNSTLLVIKGEEVLTVIDGNVYETTLSFTDESAIGFPELVDTLTMTHLYVGFDEATQNLRFRVATPDDQSETLAIRVVSEQIELIDSSFPGSPPVGARFFLNQGDFTFTELFLDGFSADDNLFSVVSGDFDNDMDLDIYAIRSNYATNQPNILWENEGNSFIRHEGAWGADGGIEGVAESVTTVDYNNDGFLDLFVTNGSSIYWLDEANFKLYRNQGNENNWLKIELQGVVSNPHGIHAKVILYAGEEAQYRYQDGGIHRFSQNDMRLHFGLGQNESIDSLVIDWPSGIHQVITSLDINEIHTILESQTSSVLNAELGKEIKSIYPNPSNGDFSITTQTEPIVGLRVLGVKGDLVYEWKDEVNRDLSHRFQLEIPPGIYTAEIHLANGIVAKKLVIN